MTKSIFINLPVRDLGRARAFYEAVGATNNPMFTDAHAACMVFSEAVTVMLLSHERFSQFTPKPIADSKTTEVLLCLSAESKAAVDRMAESAQAGGTVDPCPVQDHGFMYGRSFEDPDGHIWEVIWMDLEAFQKMQAAAAHAS